MTKEELLNEVELIFNYFAEYEELTEFQTNYRYNEFKRHDRDDTFACAIKNYTQRQKPLVAVHQ